MYNFWFKVEGNCVEFCFLKKSARQSQDKFEFSLEEVCKIKIFWKRDLKAKRVIWKLSSKNAIPVWHNQVLKGQRLIL